MRAVPTLDIAIAFGCFPHLSENLRAFGVIRGAAGKDKLAIEVAFNDAIGANDANGVFETVEAGNLRKDGPQEINVVAHEHVGNEFGSKAAIFFGEGVDGRMEKILGDGKLLGEFRRGKDRAVVFGDIAFEEIPDRGVRVGEIAVASPHPMIITLFAGFNEARRLRVMNDDKFGIK